MGETLTLEQIDDQELAKLFIHKNNESISSDQPIISDIFVHTREEFFVNNPAPSQELYEKLKKETGTKDSITTSLEKAVKTYHDKRQFKKKLNEAFRLNARKRGELMTMNIPFLGADYRYFYTYLAHYKKGVKTAWTEFNSFVDITLKVPGNFNKLKKFELGGAGILLTLLIGLLVARTFLNNWDSITPISPHSYFFSAWLGAIVTLAVIACISIVFPYVVLGIFYFININYLYKSKYFHYFICSCNFISAILFLIAFFNFLLYQYILVSKGWGIIDVNLKQN